MSTYVQIDLFSANLEQEEQLVAPRIFKSTPGATYFSKSERFTVLSDIEPGSVLFTNSIHRPTKLLVLKNENSKITCRKMFEQNHYVPNREEAEAPFEFDPEKNELLAVTQSDGLYFFSQNKQKPLRKVSANLFTNYINEYFSNGKTNELLIFRALFSHFIDTTSDVVNASNPYIAAFRNAKYKDSYGLTIGYWDNQLTMSYDHRNDIWTFNCFGTEISLSDEEVFEAYKELIRVFDLSDNEFDISTLSDFQLIALYKFEGYDVRLNFLTFEWTFKQPASTKTMYVEREELLDPREIKLKWKKFATLENVSEPKIPRGENFPRFKDRHIPNAPLKAFSIPANTTLSSESLYDLTGHRHFVVIEDLGKQVRLAPISLVFGDNHIGQSSSFKIKENEKEVVVPRTHITSATLSSADNNKSRCNIPFGIPSDFENSSTAVLEAIARYPETLTQLELKQIVAFDVIHSRHKVIQAIKEKDVKTASPLIKESNALGSTSCIPGLHNNFDSKEVSVSSHRSDFNITYSYKELVETYWAMLLSVQRFDLTELSLGELMLFYHQQGYLLSLSGIPYFFYFNRKGFHTSKYNPTNFYSMNELL